ncbi:unnamed protein product [Prunus armeniaca]|uniref:Uncharacterized protein n=1 Tax=Prunus armeniaca TaxID=36596 RepID=A0A6J5XQD0_PRUAR|nr:unnamed protein product [Prunus armeniaca]
MLHLKRRPPVLANHTIIGEHLNYNHTTVITAPYGDHWRNLCRLAAIEIFSSARFNAFASTRNDQAKQLLCKLSQNAWGLKSLMSGLRIISQ